MKIIPFIFSIAYSLTLIVGVSGVIEGNDAYSFINVSSPVTFFVDWENTGSASCNTRLRVDISGPDGNYQVWSDNCLLHPGDHAPLFAYWFSDVPGNYTANLSVFYCNDYFFVRSYNFTLQPVSKHISVKVRSLSTESRIKLRLNTSNVYIIPKKYPLGWIIPSMYANGTNIVIPYEPQYWRETDIEFFAVSPEGYTTFNVHLSKNYNWFVVLVGVLLAIFLVLRMR
ncbi:MAG TPA: hypothetical protein ENG01_01275 [Candidatus Aenigmarchaeota archaeon]|nr:MAG: hypothetical protein DRN75_03785 [Nanoarchaeota archaeon]HDO79976.1 hypothetical protein [Candidatus Aenigmarchaeota archaeon]HEX33028.1 hypothetical protein [Candidatus Aenigmarchaeota archaeon]